MSSPSHPPLAMPAFRKNPMIIFPRIHLWSNMSSAMILTPLNFPCHLNSPDMLCLYNFHFGMAIPACATLPVHAIREMSWWPPGFSSFLFAATGTGTQAFGPLLKWTFCTFVASLWTYPEETMKIVFAQWNDKNLF